MKAGLCKERFLTVALWVTGLFAAVSLHAQAMEPAVDSLRADTSEVSDPEWYVAPLVRESLHAPRRATAANNCPIDSVRTFNVDSVLESVTVYEYGDTTRTMVWTVNSDGSRYGSSRTEEGTNGNITFSATYAWDNTTGDWKGTSKEEHTFTGSKETLRTLYDWQNGAWSAKTQYTWVFDAAGRETEYTTYQRNNAGALVYSNQRLREYNAAGKMTQEINYTAHNGTDWSAGTKRIYDYDGSNTILNEYYGSLSNGAWVGSSKEVWAYTAGKKTYYEKDTWSNGAWVGSSKEIWAYNGPSAKQTLHEKYGWANGDWAITLQENSGYDTAGNNTLIENYNYNLNTGVVISAKKEEYAFNAANKKTLTLRYKWVAASSTWDYSTKLVNDYDAAGNTIETANYSWKNDAWVGTGNRTLKTYNDSKKVTEEISQTWSANAADWVNVVRKTTEYEGAKTIQEAAYKWQNDAWAGTSRSDWHYNAAGKNDTIKTYTYVGTEWIYSDRTAKTYNAAGTEIMVHNAHWDSENSKWVMTSMTRTDILDYTVDGIRQTLNTSWRCDADSVWIGVRKDTAVFSATGKQLYAARYTSWANNDWVPSYKQTLVYDEADRMLLNERYNWSSNQWKGGFRYEYGYDEQGRQNYSATYNSWNTNTGSWVGTSMTETVFNEAGQTLENTLYNWRNNQWTAFNRYLYIYDEGGRLKEQVVQSYSNNEWQNSQRFEKGYLGNQLVVSNEYFWINEVWCITSQSEKTYDEDAEAKLRREIIGQWNNSTGIVISFADNHYSYDCDPRTIRFVNYDGTLLETQTLDKGVTPSYSGVVPTREGNAEYSYTFSGWTPALAPVTSNVTYTATFTATKNTYTISWKNEDGTQIDQTTAEYGTMPTHDDASKANTAEFSYEFTGWTPGLGIVTGDATYQATFKATKNSYTITWLNEDGSPIDQTTVEYGLTPAHADINKDNTPEYAYTFAGWTPTIAEVTGNATYTATFEATKRKYTVTWLNEDGSIIGQEELEFGATPAHADINKENTAEYTYEFAGWTPTILPVVSNISYQATFTATKNSYTITFKDEDGSVISSANVEYGAMPVEPTTPTKPTDSENTYTFAGWTPTIVAVTGDAEYTATFTATKNSYTITFKNEDGYILKSSEIEYGAMPVAPESPIKTNTAEWTYTFAGWDKEVVAVTGDATYTATFTATKNSYTVTWLNSDNSPLSQTTVEYGAMPVAPADPTKASTAEYTYTFAGWDKEVVTVTGDATYTATFTATKNTYTVTWKNEDGSIISTATVEYGQVPAEPTTPTKPADSENTYTFAGWTPTIVAVTGDAEYTATFTAIKNKYLITFKDEDGSVLKSEELEYGVTPVAPEDPTKASTAEYTYTFAGWDKEVVTVTEAATYTATYTATKKTYTITWKNEDGSLIASETLEYGATPTHADITKESTAEYTYTFAGWTPAVATVIGDATYTATFTATERVENKTFTITFYYEDGVTVLDQVTVQYGETPATSLIPSKYSEEHYYYTFAGWSPEIVPAEGNASYTATFTAVPKQYTVTFKNHNGRTLLTTETPYGEIPEYTGDEPTRTKDKQYTYTFSGWSPELTEVTGPTTYTAVFEGTLNQYTVIFVDEDGTELDRQTLDYGTMPVYAGETPTKDDEGQYGYTFKGWSPKLTSVTKNATYRATYTRYDKTQGIEDVQPPCMEAQKILIGNTIYILRGGKTYTLQGVEVR